MTNTESAVQITHARTPEVRSELHEFFERYVHEIAADGVPMPDADWMFGTVALTVRDGDELIAGLMSCRSECAARALNAKKGVDPRLDKMQRLAPLHSELDLLAVVPKHRSRGIAARLVTEAEAVLLGQGVRFWFGCVTEDLEVARLREFYKSQGFRILPDGHRPPPFKGVEWVLPGATDAAFWFYKQLPQEKSTYEV